MYCTKKFFTFMRMNCVQQCWADRMYGKCDSTGFSPTLHDGCGPLRFFPISHSTKNLLKHEVSIPILFLSFKFTLLIQLKYIKKILISLAQYRKRNKLLKFLKFSHTFVIHYGVTINVLPRVAVQYWISHKQSVPEHNQFYKF